MKISRLLIRIGVPLLIGGLVFVGYHAATGFAAPAPVTTTAVPSTATTQTDHNKDEQQPSYTGSISLGQQNDQGQDNEAAGDEASDAALASLAKITPAQAEKAALTAYPNAAVVGNSLGDENGYLVYEVTLKDAQGTLEVKVDAGNSQVLATDKSDKQDGKDKSKEAEQQKSSQAQDTDNVQEGVEQGD